MRTAFQGLPPVVLASGSPRRASLLREMGLEFQIVSGEAPELHDKQLTAGELARVNAYRKARVVAKKHPDALVLGADTLVHLDTTLFGKPATLAEAFEMLRQLQGRTHHVVTAVCLLYLREHRQKILAESTAVKFRRLKEGQIRSYLNEVDPLDKAGAYAIQEQGDKLVETISGSYSNVVGLPVESLTKELQRWVIRPAAARSASPRVFAG